MASPADGGPISWSHLQTMPPTNDLGFLRLLTTTQEHFLKKFLVEHCLRDEIAHLGKPLGLSFLGPPFRPSDKKVELPLLKFFFQHFIKTFPLLASNSEKDQVEFWRDTVQPYIDSYTAKNMSDSVERRDGVTKRRQLNVRLVSVLVLFYNSVFTTPREAEYLKLARLQPSHKAKLDKFSKEPARMRGIGESFVNGLHVDIVAVEHIVPVELKRGWNPLKYIPKEKPAPHYVFVLEVQRKGQKKHYVTKRYSDFQHLESSLKSRYPLLAAEVGALPSKQKNDSGVAESRALMDSMSSGETLNGKVYHREKSRLALHGYLCSLVTKPEIAHCPELRSFLETEAFDRMSAVQAKDAKSRQQLEEQRHKTQVAFQERTAKAVWLLSRQFEKFKGELNEDPHVLSQMFKDLSQQTLMSQLLPFLRTFLDWSKLELAATFYQTFFTLDNSSDWLNTCRKMHRFFPYNLVYGVLKYTNPVKMMSRIVDILLVNMPTISLSWHGDKKKVHNLLSMVFVMMIDENLDNYSKERAQLVATSPLNEARYGIFIERIKSYVRSKDSLLSEEVKLEAEGEDLFMLLLESKLLEPRLGPQHADALAEVAQLFEAYKALGGAGAVDGARLYVLLRLLWQLEIRTRDKELMKQIWKEPELTKLLKKLLTVFFQPLMAVMRKCDVHLRFRDLQHFFNDLFDELTALDNGAMYYTTPLEMVDRMLAVMDKHEEALWRFVHDMYNKDETRFFIRLVEWLESFLVAIRTKRGSALVTLDVALMTLSVAVDPAKLVEELDARIATTLRKRQLLQEYVAVKKDSVQEQWVEMHSGVFSMSPSDFGVHADDLTEISLSQAASSADSHVHRAFSQSLAELDSKAEAAQGEMTKLDQMVHCSFDAGLNAVQHALG